MTLSGQGLRAILRRQGMARENDMLTPERRSELVAWAQHHVREIAQVVHFITTGIGHGPYEERLLKEIDTLELLRAESSDAARIPSGDAGLYMLQLAWHRGWGPGRVAAFLGDPWLSHLQRLIERAQSDRLAYDALAAHAAAILNRGEALPDLLADFAGDVLKGRRERPARRGQRYASEVRNRLLCSLVGELHWNYGLAPTRNDESESIDSGCDLVAEAMRRERMSPSSYAAIKRIWLKRPTED